MAHHVSLVLDHNPGHCQPHFHAINPATHMLAIHTEHLQRVTTETPQRLIPAGQWPDAASLIVLQPTAEGCLPLALHPTAASSQQAIDVRFLLAGSWYWVLRLLALQPCHEGAFHRSSQSSQQRH
jgi:hypothetical protein